MAEQVKKGSLSFSIAVQQSASTGLKHYGGLIEEEFKRELRGQNGMKVYREMVDNSAKIAAALFMIEQSIRKVEWRVEPWSKDVKDIEIATFFESCLDDMEHTWPEVVIAALTMLPYGFAPMEKVFKVRRGDSDDPTQASLYDDGKVGLRKLMLMAQDSISKWDIDDDTGKLMGVYQEAPPRYEEVFLPIEKVALFRTKTDRDNPEGRSILRSAYFDYYFAKKLTELAAIGAERNITGLPVIYMPYQNMLSTATSAETAVFTAMKNLVERVRNDEQAGIVMPMAYDKETKQPLFKLELLASPGGSKAMETRLLIQHHDRNMLMVMIADFITIGHEGLGSMALHGSKFSAFQMAVQGWLDAVAGVVNRQVFPDLARLNGYSTTQMPELKHGDVREQDLEMVAKIIDTLTAGGVDVFPDEVLTRHIFGLANLPTDGREEMAEKDELDTREKLEDEPEPPGPPPPPPGTPPVPPPPGEEEDEED